MDLRAELRATLASDYALDGLCAVLKREIGAGLPRNRAYAYLEELRAELRRDGLEAEEDVVLEAMDFLVGWCNPQTRL